MNKIIDKKYEERYGRKGADLIVIGIGVAFVIAFSFLAFSNLN